MSDQELDFISAALQTGSTAEAFGQGVTPEMLQVYAEEWQWIIDFGKQHHRLPTGATVEKRLGLALSDADDLDYEADQVKEKYSDSLLSINSEKVMDLIDQGNRLGALEVLEKTLTATNALLGRFEETDVLRHRDDVFADVQEFHDRIVETGSAGVPTGFKSWDSATGGCKPGELVVVGARLGGGKTWTMVQMGSAALLEGYTVLYNSLEMTRTAMSLRFQTTLSTALGRPYAAADIMTGTTRPDLDGYREMTAHLDDHVPGSLHLVDSTHGAIGTAELDGQINRIRPHIVFVDYLTLLRMTGDGDWMSISNLTKALKGMAQRYKIPIVVASQLNRADGRGRDVPGADAFSRSDSVGQDADQAVTAQKKSKRVMKYRMAKNRNGVDGFSWYVEFRPGDGVIDEITKERAYELMDEDGAEDE